MNSPNNIPHVDRELDLSNASRGVWLVKVPKYVANKWQRAPGNIEVGKLKISKSPGQRAQVQLSLSEAVICLKEEDEQNVPKEHHLDVSNVTRQALGVFAHTPSTTDTLIPDPEKLYMEGRIVQKLECRPIADRAYYKLKSESIRKASIPQRKVKQIKTIVTSFKPVSNHPSNIAYLKAKAAEGKKTRDDKDAVLNMLFAAFEKHQYYNIKYLHSLTKQPMTYLKEVLQEICNYNSKNPHKGTWELKPEYRHYKQEKPVEVQEASSDTDSD